MALERVKAYPSPLFASSQTRGLPALPPLPTSALPPSDLYQIVMNHSEHPPIMKNVSRTLAAPYKETAFHRSPSESIANNYSPAASNLNIHNLQNGPPRPPTKDRTRTLSDGSGKHKKITIDGVPGGSPQKRGVSRNGARQSPDAAARRLQISQSRPMTPREQLNTIQKNEIPESER